MEIIRRHTIMKEMSKGHLLKGRTMGFVPTMGALHEGHMSLVRRARSENDIVIVSIFVNPIQFGPSEDFGMYPKDAEADAEKLIKAGVDILFMPDAGLMYPDGFLTNVNVKGLSDKLCGAIRSGHFSGVATVVCKLFNIVLPVRAYVGRKDYQQSVIIRRMVEDLNMGVDVIVCPTIRESDGLAMSSRNAYLNPDERIAASIIFRTLVSAASLIKSGASVAAVLNHMKNNLASEALITDIQYAGIYDPDTLDELDQFKKGNLLAIALKIGNTRLIDNMVVEL